MRIIENVVAALLVFGFAVGLSACKDDGYPEGPLPGTEYDILPVVIKVYVTDSEGHDLLNPEVTNTIVNNKIKVLYKIRNMRCIGNRSILLDQGRYRLCGMGCRCVNLIMKMDVIF